MTAVGLESLVQPTLGIPRATSGGGTKAIHPGWSGTTLGAAFPRRVTEEVGTALRSFAVGMLEALDLAWPSTTTRYYQLLVDDIPGTGSAFLVHRPERPVEFANASLLVPDRAIAEIRATLSLNVSETARALGVERPTVYAWLAGQVTPQRANILRLARVADVAASWRRRTSRPLGSLVRVPGTDGRSIAEMLADDTLGDRVLQERLDAFANLLRSGTPLRGRRVATVREAAANHGLATRPDGDSATEVDWLTRPSFGDEDD